jgi:uncharacterized metal-binding protein
VAEPYEAEHRRLNMTPEKDIVVNCAKCPRPVCNSVAWQEGPDNCPSKILPDVIKKATEICLGKELHDFAVQASKQEGSGYMKLPHAPRGPSPVKSRVEEIMEFARRMSYQKLGVAYCSGVQFEASLLVPILENRGFDVVSVVCKCGSVPKEELGIDDWEKVVPGRFEAMCHPIAQAEIINSFKTDLNIMLCLCVGHDSLFLKHSQAPCTILAAKDRVFGHAPLMALYQSKSYHRRVMARENKPDAAKEAERETLKNS